MLPKMLTICIGNFAIASIILVCERKTFNICTALNVRYAMNSAVLYTCSICICILLCCKITVFQRLSFLPYLNHISEYECQRCQKYSNYVTR